MRAADYKDNIKPLTFPCTYFKPIYGFRLSNLPCGTLRVCRSRFGLRNPNRKDLFQRQAATRAQGYPVSGQPLPAIEGAVEGIRGLEKTIWNVHLLTLYGFVKLTFVSIQDL